MTIGVMAAALLLTAACGRGTPEPTPETTAQTAPAPSVTSDRPDSPTLVAVKRRGRLNCGVHQ
ncbi:MAG: amino acid ABC transporter substrate-binding protein, partial [Brevundimonas sp.]